MTNAKDELLQAINGLSKLKCALIHYRGNEIKLNIGYSECEYNIFLKTLNFSYNAGYGGQELYGTLWHEDGTWQERGEHDGCEWWEYRQLPEIPLELL